MNDDNAPQLGITQGHIILHDVKGTAELACALTRQARREILIFTHDLDARVYDQESFIDALTHFALQHHRAQCKVLLQDSSGLIKQGHRLIELARRLSSRIELRKTAPDHANDLQNFLVADARGYLHRELYARYEGNGDFNDPLRAKALVNQYNMLWEHAEPDSELRRLHV
jgi:hypothetical protein